MTKIYFERSGGFMGRKVSLNLDMDELPDDEAELLRELLEEADFFELPDDLTSSDIPDAFTYLINVKLKEKQHSVRVSDTTIPDDLRPLLFF